MEFAPTAEEAIDLVEAGLAWWTAPSHRAGPTPAIRNCGAASTARPGSTPRWSACSTGNPCASTTLFLGAPMMLKRSLLHRVPRSSATLAPGSATKIVEDVASSLREKRHPVENSVKATKKVTLSSRASENPPRGLSHTSSGGYSTPATAARTVPTVRRTMPPEACFSSQIHGVLNNLSGLGALATHGSPGGMAARGEQGTRASRP